VNQRPSAFLLVPLSLALAVLGACGGADSQPSGEPAAASLDDLPVAELGTRWATASADSLETLVASTDWQFTAEVIGLDHQEQIDVVPDVPGATPAPPDPDKPIPANDGPPPFPVSYWEVRVVDVLAGDLTPGDTVIVRQMGGVHEQSDGSLVRVQFEHDPPLEPGEQYLFFTRASSNGVVQTSPFMRMRAAADGSYAAEGGWADMGAMSEISSLGQAGARSAIRAAAAGTGQ
jgi:hypothetical protein